MAESKVFLFDNEDPGMQQAYGQARANFRLFWREIASDRRRIIPALEMAGVKAPFWDVSKSSRGKDDPGAEHMWFSDVDYDGEFVSGVLLNSPNWVKSVRQGEDVRVPLHQISDWMFVMGGEVYGAYTVNLLRSRMKPRERQDHDEAWGLDFGDPTEIRFVPEANHRQLSENMAAVLMEHLAQNPSMLTTTGMNGWTLLHQDASAGSVAAVKALLAAGADPHAKADNGMTPRQLAEALGWHEVVELLPS
ncbi:MAG: DUF2314 domain-containing protein [Fimbriiglobus sp.]